MLGIEMLRRLAEDSTVERFRLLQLPLLMEPERLLQQPGQVELSEAGGPAHKFPPPPLPQ